MRRAAACLAILLLASCAPPTGAGVPECDASWSDVEPVIVQAGAGEERSLAIDCMQAIDRRRVRIGFTMPPGPDCHRLSRIEVVEGADRVSITLFVRVDDGPAAGACADEPQRTVTEIELAAAVQSRDLLDGS